MVGIPLGQSRSHEVWLPALVVDPLSVPLGGAGRAVVDIGDARFRSLERDEPDSFRATDKGDASSGYLDKLGNSRTDVVLQAVVEVFDDQGSGA